MSTVEKIAALLTMAERTDNVHEAEAFFAKAQQLATLASVDLALARAATARAEAREKPLSKTIQIGQLRARINRHLVNLFVGLAQANDISVDVAHNSTYVIAYGMPSDIEVTETMFGSIATQMVTFADVFIRKGEWREDAYVAYQRTPRGRTVAVWKKHTALTARGAFYAGFTQTISERVAKAREETIATRIEQDRNAGAVFSTAVVLRDKEKEVKAFYKQNSEARGAWQGYTGAGSSGQGGQSQAEGRAAARRARINSTDSITNSPNEITH